MSSKTSSPRASRRPQPPRKVNVAPAEGKRHTIGNICAALAGLGLGMALALELHSVSRHQLSSLGGQLTLLGRISAMSGTYAMIIVLFLVARIPWLEREVGFDRTVSWHRKLAPYSLLLIGLHVVFTTVGWGMTDGSGTVHEFWKQLTTTRWILPATVGFILLMSAGITSYKVARRRMAYETWWVIHLYTYVAVALSYAHQVTLGNAFIAHPLAQKVWLYLTISAISCLFLFRWILPIARGWKYDLRVHAVVPEGPGVVSVWMTGRKLHKLKASGGQFFCWRFMTPELWWHAHPYSLSAPPDGRYLRITVKDLGDHSAALAHIKPGTKVLAEGPYGAFTASRRHGDRVVLIGAGVGITPIRAVLEELPSYTTVDVLYRARSHEEVVLKRELDALAERPNTNVRYLVGSRKEHPMDPRTLLRLAPHIQNSDVFICGPDALTSSVKRSVEILGVPESHIHDEAFAF